MNKKSLLIDIGNSSLKSALYSDGNLSMFRSFRIVDIPLFKRYISQSGIKLNLNNIIICSNNPKISNIIKKVVFKITRLKPLFIGHEIGIDIYHNYRNINKLGKDRLINIYGAIKMGYAPSLLISSGTALTFDLVSARGVFEGGLIIPGAETSFRSLLNQAALLPKKLRFPEKIKTFPGHSTEDCLTAGILKGYGAMISGLILDFKSRCPKLKVIAMGGNILALKPYILGIDRYDPLHTLKSLGQIANSIAYLVP
ncbi:MAG: type III pantothenate kinase [Candidatus Omnitrophota bacterium]